MLVNRRGIHHEKRKCCVGPAPSTLIVISPTSPIPVPPPNVYAIHTTLQTRFTSFLCDVANDEFVLGNKDAKCVLSYVCEAGKLLGKSGYFRSHVTAQYFPIRIPHLHLYLVGGFNRLATAEEKTRKRTGNKKWYVKFLGLFYFRLFPDPRSMFVVPFLLIYEPFLKTGHNKSVQAASGRTSQGDKMSPITPKYQERNNCDPYSWTQINNVENSARPKVHTVQVVCCQPAHTTPTASNKW